MSTLGDLEFVRPADIEARSFEIIGREMGPHDFDPATEMVVKRVIHATADFDFARTLSFSSHAVGHGIEALRSGAHIVTDTAMAAAGINKRVLGRLGGEVHTFVAAADVAEEARARGITRAAVGMERAAKLDEPLVFAIGNAPTALVRLAQLLEEGALLTPALVIGVPVGFVNVVESKDLIMRMPVEHIVAQGRKGGTPVAVAICNALLYLAADGRV